MDKGKITRLIRKVIDRNCGNKSSHVLGGNRLEGVAEGELGHRNVTIGTTYGNANEIT